VLTEEGKTYMKNGSPEALFFSAIPPEGISRNNLKVVIPFYCITRLGESMKLPSDFLLFIGLGEIGF
jgi:hypothetical protein